KEMDEFGDYRQIISLPNPAIEDIAAPDVGLNLARIANDAMAELCRKHPERFPGFAAALCMTNVEGSVAEARRAGKDLGARGVLLYTTVAGRPLDDPEAAPPLLGTLRVGSVFCNDRRPPPADLASSRRHGGNARLSLREEIAIRDVVVFPLALRDVGRDGAHGFLRPVRSLSEAENHHAPPRRNDPILRRSRRSGPQGARPAYIGRGLLKNSSVSETTAPRLRARLLWRHGDVGRGRCCNALWPGVLRPRSGGFRDRHAAGPDRTDNSHGQEARPRSGRRTKTFLR